MSERTTTCDLGPMGAPGSACDGARTARSTAAACDSITGRSVGDARATSPWSFHSASRAAPRFRRATCTCTVGRKCYIPQNGGRPDTAARPHLLLGSLSGRERVLVRQQRDGGLAQLEAHVRDR